MKTLILVIVAFQLWSHSAVAGDLSPGEFSVGVATVDITPAHPVRLNGYYGRNIESTGVRQPLYAKALAVSADGSEPIVVVTVDTLGIPDAMTERIAARLKDKVGLTREHFAVCASHTHTGPMIKDCANTLFGMPIPDDHWQRILKYTNHLEAGIEQAALDAVANRQPAKLSWGIGKVDFAVNRRTSGGPIDHDLPVLAVHAPDGSLRAVFTNYACHCVVLGDTQLSGDWAGYAQDHIQRHNPGCTALISIGCGADSNPRGRGAGDPGTLADSLGQQIAAEVQRLLKTGLTPITATPSGQLQRVALPLAPLPSRERWEELAKDAGAVGHHARTQLGRLDRGEALLMEIDYPIQSISFGNELAWVFLPGEVVVDYSLRLKRELDGARVWINAYANACPGYVPSERILKEGGYEGGGAMIYYDIPGPYATGLEQTIVSVVQNQLGDDFRPAVDIAKTDGIRPQSPDEAVRSLRVKPGFRVELVAAEPLIQSPVAVAFDPDGRVWVAEMRDYPRAEAAAAAGEQDRSDPTDPSSISGGAIRCLFDDDHDGRMDRSHVFLDGLPYPTGVTVWRNGVLICAAPDILYAEDTDGDGRADKVEKLFTGFATHNFQARVNSLEYGLDGWVYGSCGLFGGDITSVKTGQVISLGQRDFRCKPDTGEFEPVTGSSQQGRVRNDAGDWFGCNNTTLLMHYPLDDEMLRRNPYALPTTTVVNIAAGSDPGLLFPVSSQVLFALSGPPGRPTAACGLGIYRDDLLGQEYSGNAFTCEPVNNLVHRQVLVPTGATFTAKRGHGEEDREFLASSDPWFRPVQVRTGPDGALWVVDMSRYVIEHPIWIPPDRLAQLDPRAGSTMGRIYRVVRDSAQLRRMPDLRSLQGEQLVAAMASANGTQRDLVQQVLEWRSEPAPSETTALAKASLDVTLPGPSWQRLWTWHNTSKEKSPFLASRADGAVALMQDFTAAIQLGGQFKHTHGSGRRNAIRVISGIAGQMEVLHQEFETRSRDVDSFVRQEAAYAAGVLPPRVAAEILRHAFLNPANDQYVIAAAESSLNQSNVVEVLTELRRFDAPPEAIERVMFSAVPLAEPAAALTLLQETAGAVQQAGGDFQQAESFYAMSTFCDAWSRRPVDEFAPHNQAARELWQPILNKAAVAATRDDVDPALRLAAIAVLRHGVFLGEPQSETLLALLMPKTPPQVQRAAVKALITDDRPETAAALLEDWNSRGPELRTEIVDELLSRQEWTAMLLTAIAAGQLSSAELSLARKQDLLNHPDASIRDAAAQCLRVEITSDRQTVIDQYVAALELPASSERGRAVFARICAACHQVREIASGTNLIGHEVGPDIAGYSSKPPTALLTAMFNPGAAVDPRYQPYTAALSDGRIMTGLVRDETASGFVLLAADAKRTDVRRSEVDELRSTGKSLMPEGLEQSLSPQDAADLWAWLRTMRSPPKSLEGNLPAIVTVPESGAVALHASQAEIRGGDITFELTFQNVGYWHGVDDSVRWRLHSPTLRRADVWAEFACDPGSAGGRIRIDGVEPSLTTEVPSTGAWSRYQLLRVGTVVIPAGDCQLLITPDDPPRAALIDLRTIHLVDCDTVPLAAGSVEDLSAPTMPGDDPVSIAEFLLDDRVSAELREAMIAKHLAKAAEIILAMAAGLPDPSGSDEEYRRIPWIWRVAIAAGKSGDESVIHAALEKSLPNPDQPLTHWQAVVLGGGLINGLSQRGVWPQRELTRLIGDDTNLRSLWARSVLKASQMADDETVPDGTRYDALRMIAMQDWPDCRGQLDKYIRPGVSPELQTGALSGLADNENAEATELLLMGMAWYSPDQRTLVAAALMRSEPRMIVMLNQIAEARFDHNLLSPAQQSVLREHSNPTIRDSAQRLLADQP